jgi:hypothetical protein
METSGGFSFFPGLSVNLSAVPVRYVKKKKFGEMTSAGANKLSIAGHHLLVR